jgi:hypothetical protein
MAQLDLLEETLSHFSEGARSVKAYTDDKTYIITKAGEHEFWITLEEPGFPKNKTKSLDEHFKEVIGIEAHY